MEIITTLINLIVSLCLILCPLIIIKKSFNNFFIYTLFILIIGLILTTFLGWWLEFSNILLLKQYGYDFSGLNEYEYYKNVKIENLVQVKSLETKLMGIGWPLKSIFLFIFFSSYSLLVYFINIIFKKYK
jgi:hypothetical protein